MILTIIITKLKNYYKKKVLDLKLKEEKSNSFKLYKEK